ncbi:MAG: 2-oxo acid dehydrogenase subunit E2 [Bacillota bacterium]
MRLFTLNRNRITLTSDHRIIDGAIAAQFLDVFKNICQNLTIEDVK